MFDYLVSNLFQEEEGGDGDLEQLLKFAEVRIVVIEMNRDVCCCMRVEARKWV